jgi:hypothetical protein
MLSHVNLFEDWLRSMKPPKRRFHPIPIEIIAPFNEESETFGRRMVDLRKGFLPQKGIEIYMDFIDDGSCNAAAGLSNSVGLIGINKGLILFAQEIFFRMFSHPNVLTDLGEINLERKGTWHDDPLPMNFNHLLNYRNERRRPLLADPPVDALRRRTANACLNIFRGFITIHELVHIVHGHVEYLQRKRAIPFIIESYPSTSPETLDLDYQSAELWSDSMAVAVVLGGLLKSSAGITQAFPKPLSKVFLFAFSIYVLFRLWGLKVDPDDLRGRLHPPTLIRFEMALISAKLDLMCTCPELVDVFWDIAKHARDAAERSLRYSGLEPLDSNDIAPKDDPRVIGYREELINHFRNALYPELLKYSHVSIDRVIHSDLPSQPEFQMQP